MFDCNHQEYARNNGSNTVNIHTVHIHTSSGIGGRHPGRGPPGVPPPPPPSHLATPSAAPEGATTGGPVLELLQPIVSLLAA